MGHKCIQLVLGVAKKKKHTKRKLWRWEICSPTVRAVPRCLQRGQVVEHAPHLAQVQRLADHDGGATRAHGQHLPHARRADNLGAGACNIHFIAELEA